MTKQFERTLIDMSHDIVFKKANFIQDEYRLDIKDLTAEEKLAFVDEILKINSNLDGYIQEYLDYACQDRLYAESEPYGAWEDE